MSRHKKINYRENFSWKKPWLLLDANHIPCNVWCCNSITVREMQIIKNGEKYTGHIMFTRFLKHVLSSSLKGNSGSAHPGGFWSSVLTGRVGWTGGSRGPRRQDHLRGRGNGDDDDDDDDDLGSDDDDWGSRTLERCELQLLNFLKQERFLTTIVFLPCNTRSSWDLSYTCLGTSVAKFLPPWRVRCWGSLVPNETMLDQLDHFRSILTMWNLVSKYPD